jgi:proline iminopeptidase
MRRFLLLITMLLLATVACQQEAELAEPLAEPTAEAEAVVDENALYPMIEPFATGFLKVSDIHELYWEISGNENGYPVIGLHGGPGGSAGPDMRQFFDPEKFKIILFDQRGAGRSKPKAEWRENNTQVLIEDINTLRNHLNIEGPAMIFGGSWGSTLAVAYAEAYPELVSGLVMRGIFLGSKYEIDHFFHGGTEAFFPGNFARLQSIVPNPQSLNYPEQLFQMTQIDDPAVREKAIKGWAYYEIRLVAMDMTDETCQQIVDNYDMTTFSVLENHYMMNNCFVGDGELLREADKIAHIPTYIVNGRYDFICPPKTAIALAAKFTTVKLDLPIAAHSSRSPAIARGLVGGVKWVAEQIGIE